MNVRLPNVVRHLITMASASALFIASPMASADLARAMAAYDQGSFDEALRELNDPATASQPRAQFLLGLMYANGEGVTMDRSKAAEHLRRSHGGGFQPAGDALAALGLGAGPAPRAMAAPANPPTDATVRAMPAPMRDTHATSGAMMSGTSLSGTQLQLGAFSNLARAQRVWDDVRARAPDSTSDLSADFPSANSGGRQIYRVRVGPFDGPEAARQRCADLVARGAVPDCLVIR